MLRAARFAVAVVAGTGVLVWLPSAVVDASVQRKPDLAIGSVSYDADCVAHTLFIEVTVVNASRVPAGSFAVGLEFNEERQPPHVIDVLPADSIAKASWTVEYYGSWELDREHVDLRDRVRESDETNNAWSDQDIFCSNRPGSHVL